MRGNANQMLRFVSNGFNQVQSNSDVFTAKIGKKFKYELGNFLEQFKKFVALLGIHTFLKKETV